MQQNEETDTNHEHWMSKVDELPTYYKINKYVDGLFDKLPYSLGWGLYNTYYDVRRIVITTYQKIRYGVSDEECWSLDATLTKLILPRLKHFKNMKRHGHPVDITEEQWNDVIDELIWTFEYLDNPDKFNPFPDSIYSDLLNLNYNDKTDEQKQALKSYMDKSSELEERKNKGLELFAKYYSNMWD